MIDGKEISEDIFEKGDKFIVYYIKKIYGIFDKLKDAQLVRNTLKNHNWDLNFFEKNFINVENPKKDFAMASDDIIYLKSDKTFNDSDSIDNLVQKGILSKSYGGLKKRMVGKRVEVFYFSKKVGQFNSDRIANRFIEICNNYDLDIFKSKNIFFDKSEYHIFRLNKDPNLQGVVFREHTSFSPDRAILKVREINKNILKENFKKVEKGLSQDNFHPKAILGNNFRRTVDGIFYLYKYYPTKQQKLLKRQSDIDISHQIVDYKNWAKRGNLNSKRAFNKFTGDLKRTIVEFSNFIDKKIVLVGIPSSDANSKNSIAGSIGMIADNRKIFDGSDILTRVKSVLPSRCSVERNSAEDHYNSIGCSKNLDNDCLYILLDDVYTAGITWNACKNILIENGVSKDNILGFVIGRTEYVNGESDELTPENLLRDIYKYCLELTLDGENDIVKKASQKYFIKEDVIEKCFDVLKWDELLEEAAEQTLSEEIVYLGGS